MKSLFKVLLLFAVLAGIALFLISQQNNTSFRPQTIDLIADCSQVEDMLVTSTVNVQVSNVSGRSHRDISVRLIAYDESGNAIKEKYTTFQRDLGPNDSFSKPVTLPARTRTCQCEIVSSNPY